MRIIDLQQGSSAWHAHRANHYNASDAPAMMGCSSYKSRADLVRERATGIIPDVDEATQRRFNDGHKFEALARPLAEQITGEDFSPCVGAPDDESSKLSASFDGISFAGDVAFEHKSLNDRLRAAMHEGCTGADLSLEYQVQMEHQAMVSGCERILFMASKWRLDHETGEWVLEEERHCWYTPNPALRARIVAGWEQFEADVAAYVVPDAAPVMVAEAVTALPAVFAQVTGSIALKDNLPEYEVALRDFIEHRLIRQPETDQDFANLDLQIKALKGAEAALDASEEQALSQAEMLSAFKRQKDMLHKLTRDTRLAAEKLLAAEKERVKAVQVQRGQKAFADHIAGLNTRLGKPYMPQVPCDFAGAIKGKRTVESLVNAVDTELARAKIAANEIADRIQINLATLRELAGQHAFLFADTAAIVLKAPDDLTTLVKARIAEHAAQEAARIEAERQRIRAEEQEKARREAEALAEQREKERQAEIAHAALLARQESEAKAVAEAVTEQARRPEVAPGKPLAPAPAPIAAAPVAGGIAPAVATGDAADDGATLTLGQLNALLSPIKLDAAGIEALGFHVTRVRAAVHFQEAQFPALLARLVQHIHNIHQTEVV